MSKIILVRHGEPDIKIVKMINGLQIEEFLTNYDKSAIKKSSLPCDTLTKLAQKCHKIVCSDLERSISSAAALGKIPDEVDAVYSESKPPFLKVGWINLPPKVWLIFSRLLWVVGYSKNGESLKQTKQRAKISAQKLITHSKEGDVMFMGHGLINIFIAKELRKIGYKGSKVPARKYWEYGIYIL